MQTSSSFTQQDGLFINSHFHQFIEQQLAPQAAMLSDDIYQVLATLVDEFGCTCRKTKHNADDVLDVQTLLNAYQHNNHPYCNVDSQTTEAVLDEHCCQVPAIIVVALMDTLSGTFNTDQDAHAIYHRAAQLTNRACTHRVNLVNVSAA
ncbi:MULTISPECIES: hypothetical protein [Pseudoalteromonas]|uniref:Orphan protein n=1 Tax=Pseudoalteromonas translucida (strain TAC 125) TaxID=326442 RepID=Q3IKZ6_PSET1|nr:MULTISPECIES: hypothetical protein [Pseudoalteromonas]MBB1404296.1 hypothetical protein [Pseudoalteromonas sp. SG44-5]CAI86379.1 putative orphan protein [Pseudoalteromonas translucida]